MIKRETVNSIIEIYKNAWENQDPELILKIFHPNATYHERVFEDPYYGHKEIKQYWEIKVVNQQRNIQFKLLSVYLDQDSNTAIVEWDAEFDDLKQDVRKSIREVAILKIDENDKILSLREYWASKNNR